MRFSAVTIFTAVASLVATANAYWMGDIAHQGVAPFAGSGYRVFRNVKDYGAKGDGVTDDTAAINAAINDGNRCGKGCASSTTTPAVVYLPAGTYVISSSILPAYFTQIIGDANNPPTLKATAGFSGFGLIDGNPYYTSDLNWISTNVFYRQVRNLILDTTNIAPATAATGMHWPTSQATSLQNIVFNMPTSSDVVHVGLFIESGGSGGFLSDLTFIGGATGASMGNQQYTMRNLTFRNCKTAIIQLWDWGWTYMGLSITDCGVGIDISAGGSSDQKTGSLTLIDSTLTNVPVGVLTAWTPSASPATAGSVILENLSLNNVPVMVKGPSGTALAGSSGSTTINAWGEGHQYIPSGPQTFQGNIAGNSRPAALLSGNRYYTRSKPQYESLPASSFVSARSSGARGDGSTDDTAALQSAINAAASAGQVLYLDYGIYRVTSTITVPPGARIVGETYPVIMSSGGAFADMNSPRAVVRVGSSSGQAGYVELSDFVVGTQGAQAGATLIEWNLATTGGAPSGMWDVHTRVGGFRGSDLQVAQCLKQPGSSAVNGNCIGAYMLMHVTGAATGLYMENNWLWTADHDMEDQSNTQITIFSGRGLYIESTVGTFWLVGTAAEHNVLYQYQFSGTKNIFASQLQTETPYYQPSPLATTPFPVNSALNDPDFSASCAGVSGTCAMAWGLRIINSQNILAYGAGHYSFFNNYSTNCSTVKAGENCQARIISLEGSLSNVNIYNLNTIGSLSMINRDGRQLAYWQDNINVYPDTIALFLSG
ncbi:uncharacterized protein E0L32_011444 [Thyridium curvatum]|uniref:Rhamnogalacturonase A/B/Epimerase-like pectate lyase domain-containing protein n=1 Tax=Thyridium curvatum TaxID=1093900 RepID=A0A507B987_9PEZI|nr:uncharacterized protein E0L32_011444 [Thyridium curvatum]TPX18892.1 hypothetical protein E0L32_011444 [Thyridium curvatum]